MKHFLIVVDMQKDFIDGALGSAEAVAVLPAAKEVIRTFDGEIIATLDTHAENYLETAEGRKLPVKHCIEGTEGHALHTEIAAALDGRKYELVRKPTFGSKELPRLIEKMAAGEDFTVTLIGLCTDICVVTNALLLKTAFPEADIAVVEKACAGVTKASHDAAIMTMKSCQIEIK